MSTRGKYRHYDDHLRHAAVIGSVPESMRKTIPRSTLHYWRRNLTGAVKANSVNQNPYKAEEIAALKNALASVFKAFVGDLDVKQINAIERQNLAELLRHKHSNLSRLLPVGVRAKLTIRLKSCTASMDGLCVRRFPRRVSNEVVAVMKQYVTSRKYACMSIASIIILARRRGQVVCNAKTWYQYIKKLGWQRPQAKNAASKKRVGIRANHAHEIWHVDASKIKTERSPPLYLQVVVDNFSRFVLAWQMVESINADSTARLLERVRREYSRSHVMPAHTLLLADGGGENMISRHLAQGENLAPKILIRRALFDTWASNSMIESFFRMLKTNHIRRLTLVDKNHAVREVGRFIREHNHRVPYAGLNGLTPFERLSGVKECTQLPAEVIVARWKRKSVPTCALCR